MMCACNPSTWETQRLRQQEGPEFEARPDWAIKWEQSQTKARNNKPCLFGIKVSKSFVLVALGLWWDLRTARFTDAREQRETDRGQGSKNPFQGHIHDLVSFHLPHSYHRDWAPNLQYGSQRMAAWSLKAEFPSQGGWRSGEAPVMGAVLFMQHEYVLEI